MEVDSVSSERIRNHWSAAQTESEYKRRQSSGLPAFPFDFDIDFIDVPLTSDRALALVDGDVALGPRLRLRRLRL